MSITDKMFFTSTLIDAAGCQSDTFRSWRNRNGLFPETMGTGKWNKHSIVDILVAAIVTDATQRGLSAQLAVDAAMAAAPMLAEVCNVPSAKVTPIKIEQLFDEVMGIGSDFPVLAIGVDIDGAPKARLLSPECSVADAFEDPTWSMMIVKLRGLIPYVLFRLCAHDTAFIDAGGAKRLRAGWLSETFNGGKPRAVRGAKPSTKPVNAKEIKTAPKQGKR